MSKKKDSGKGIALTVATAMVTFGLQQLTVGNSVTGGIGVLIGLLLFVGYQVAESKDHGKAYDDIVDAIGEDNFKELANMSADELRNLRNEIN